MRVRTKCEDRKSVSSRDDKIVSEESVDVPATTES